MGVSQDPLLPFLDLDQTTTAMQTGDFNAIACAFYWVEQLMARREYTQIRGRYKHMTAFCLSFLEEGVGLFTRDEDYKSKLFAHLEKYLNGPNIVLCTEITEGVGVSTDDIMEGGCVLLEIFHNFMGDDGGRADERMQKSMPTSYMDALAFGSGVLGTPTSWEEAVDMLLSLAVGVDVALDTPSYPGGMFLGMFDQDLFVPARFNRALQTMKRIGFLNARRGITPLEVERYKQWLCDAARLGRPWRFSEDLNQSHTDLYERIWQSGWEGRNEVVSEGHTLYSMLSFLHAKARRLRRTRGLFSGTDILCAMLSESGIYDDHAFFADESEKDLFTPILLVYENGELGFKAWREGFAWHFMISSLGTYPLFDVAWRKGTVPLGPVDYAPIPILDYRATATELIVRRFEQAE
jgi:hypothetical protein